MNNLATDKVTSLNGQPSGPTEPNYSLHPTSNISTPQTTASAATSSVHTQSSQEECWICKTKGKRHASIEPPPLEAMLREDGELADLQQAHLGLLDRLSTLASELELCMADESEESKATDTATSSKQKASLIATISAVEANAHYLTKAVSQRRAVITKLNDKLRLEYDNDPMTILHNVCACKGATGTVHRQCLERWVFGVSLSSTHKMTPLRRRNLRQNRNLLFGQNDAADGNVVGWQAEQQRQQDFFADAQQPQPQPNEGGAGAEDQPGGAGQRPLGGGTQTLSILRPDCPVCGEKYIIAPVGGRRAKERLLKGMPTSRNTTMAQRLRFISKKFLRPMVGPIIMTILIFTLRVILFPLIYGMIFVYGFGPRSCFEFRSANALTIPMAMFDFVKDDLVSPLIWGRGSTDSANILTTRVPSLLKGRTSYPYPPLLAVARQRGILRDLRKNGSEVPVDPSSGGDGYAQDSAFVLSSTVAGAYNMAASHIKKFTMTRTSTEHEFDPENTADFSSSLATSPTALLLYPSASDACTMQCASLLNLPCLFSKAKEDASLDGDSSASNVNRLRLYQPMVSTWATARHMKSIDIEGVPVVEYFSVNNSSAASFGGSTSHQPYSFAIWGSSLLRNQQTKVQRGRARNGYPSPSPKEPFPLQWATFAYRDYFTSIGFFYDSYQWFYAVNKAEAGVEHVTVLSMVTAALNLRFFEAGRSALILFEAYCYAVAAVHEQVYYRDPPTFIYQYEKESPENFLGTTEQVVTAGWTAVGPLSITTDHIFPLLPITYSGGQKQTNESSAKAASSTPPNADPPPHTSLIHFILIVWTSVGKPWLIGFVSAMVYRAMVGSFKTFLKFLRDHGAVNSLFPELGVDEYDMMLEVARRGDQHDSDAEDQDDSDDETDRDSAITRGSATDSDTGSSYFSDTAGEGKGTESGTEHSEASDKETLSDGGVGTTSKSTGGALSILRLIPRPPNLFKTGHTHHEDEHKARPEEDTRDLIARLRKPNATNDENIRLPQTALPNVTADPLEPQVVKPPLAFAEDEHGDDKERELSDDDALRDSPKGTQKAVAKRKPAPAKSAIGEDDINEDNVAVRKHKKKHKENPLSAEKREHKAQRRIIIAAERAAKSLIRPATAAGEFEGVDLLSTLVPDKRALRKHQRRKELVDEKKFLSVSQTKSASVSFGDLSSMVVKPSKPFLLNNSMTGNTAANAASIVVDTTTSTTKKKRSNYRENTGGWEPPELVTSEDEAGSSDGDSFTGTGTGYSSLNTSASEASYSSQSEGEPPSVGGSFASEANRNRSPSLGPQRRSQTPTRSHASMVAGLGGTPSKRKIAMTTDSPSLLSLKRDWANNRPTQLQLGTEAIGKSPQQANLNPRSPAKKKDNELAENDAEDFSDLQHVAAHYNIVTEIVTTVTDYLTGVEYYHPHFSPLRGMVLRRWCVEFFNVGFWFSVVSIPELWLIGAMTIVTLITICRIRVPRKSLKDHRARFTEPFTAIPNCTKTDSMIWFASFIGDVIVFTLLLPIVGGFMMQYAAAPFFSMLCPFFTHAFYAGHHFSFPSSSAVYLNATGTTFVNLYINYTYTTQGLSFLASNPPIFYVPTVWSVACHWLVGSMCLIVLVRFESIIMHALFASGVDLFFVRSVALNAVNNDAFTGWKFAFAQIYDYDPLQLFIDMFRVGIFQVSTLVWFVRFPVIVFFMVWHRVYVPIIAHLLNPIYPTHLGRAQFAEDDGTVIDHRGGTGSDTGLPTPTEGESQHTVHLARRSAFQAGSDVWSVWYYGLVFYSDHTEMDRALIHEDMADAHLDIIETMLGFVLPFDKVLGALANAAASASMWLQPAMVSGAYYSSALCYHVGTGFTSWGAIPSNRRVGTPARRHSLAGVTDRIGEPREGDSKYNAVTTNATDRPISDSENQTAEEHQNAYGIRSHPQFIHLKESGTVIGNAYRYVQQRESVRNARLAANTTKGASSAIERLRIPINPGGHFFGLVADIAPVLIPLYPSITTAALGELQKVAAAVALSAYPLGISALTLNNNATATLIQEHTEPTSIATSQPIIAPALWLLSTLANSAVSLAFGCVYYLCQVPLDAFVTFVRWYFYEFVCLFLVAQLCACLITYPTQRLALTFLRPLCEVLAAATGTRSILFDDERLRILDDWLYRRNQLPAPAPPPPPQQQDDGGAQEQQQQQQPQPAQAAGNGADGLFGPFDEGDHLVMPEVPVEVMFTKREFRLDPSLIPSHNRIRCFVVGLMFFSISTILSWSPVLFCSMFLFPVVSRDGTTNAAMLTMWSMLFPFMAWDPRRYFLTLTETLAAVVALFLFGIYSGLVLVLQWFGDIRTYYTNRMKEMEAKARRRRAREKARNKLAGDKANGPESPIYPIQGGVVEYGEPEHVFTPNQLGTPKQFPQHRGGGAVYSFFNSAIADIPTPTPTNSEGGPTPHSSVVDSRAVSFGAAVEAAEAEEAAVPHQATGANPSPINNQTMSQPTIAEPDEDTDDDKDDNLLSTLYWARCIHEHRHGIRWTVAEKRK